MRGERVNPVDTPYGPSQAIFRVQSGDHHFLFMPRHGEATYDTPATSVNYRANIYAMKDLGVRHIVAWGAVGAINAALSVGQLVVPHDLIDETRSRASSFYTKSGAGFLRYHEALCPTLRAAILSATTTMSTPAMDEAVYVCTEGPRIETPAEVQKYRAANADIVGMTLCPEAFLARELEMCYAAVCYVSNYAEGVVERPREEAAVLEGLANESERAAANATALRFAEVITYTLEALAETPPICHCPTALQRYRDRGDISVNWRENLGP
jgi:5'-methylthioadenosine phosphorylase